MKRHHLNASDSQSWKQFGTTSGDEWFVYRFYDTEGLLLYVGITWNPFERWSRHKRTKAWWSQVSAVALVRVSGELEVRAAETQAIHAERPRYNIHQVRRTDAENQDDQA